MVGGGRGTNGLDGAWDGIGTRMRSWGGGGSWNTNRVVGIAGEGEETLEYKQGGGGGKGGGGGGGEGVGIQIGWWGPAGEV